MRRVAGCLSIPRVVLLLVWWLTPYVDTAYRDAGRLWLFFLGFLFMPLTTLAWAFIVYFGHDTTDWWPAAVIATVLFDVGLLDRWVRQDRKKRKDD